MLGHLIQVGHRDADLVDPVVLLTGCRTDIAQHLGDARHAIGQLVHGGFGVAYHLRAAFDLIGRRIDALANVLGGVAAARGELAHFIGHHGKAAPVFASPRCFY